MSEAKPELQMEAGFFHVCSNRSSLFGCAVQKAIPSFDRQLLPERSRLESVRMGNACLLLLDRLFPLDWPGPCI